MKRAALAGCIVSLVASFSATSCASKSEVAAGDRFYLYRSGRNQEEKKPKPKPEPTWTAHKASGTTEAGAPSKTGEYLSVPSGFVSPQVIAKSSGVANSDLVKVGSYTRSDGQVVGGHYRTAPNTNTRDNFSSRGNVNPVTRKLGTR